ncbi:MULTISPECIES: PAS domain-containing sensor histidine kinase [Nitrospirillum]|uniref:histidine kinase n=1 Tax=Nitrospirillum amazonense TaxID=28077 RepID=A0A560G3L1_9PROT|nr:PAS domain-containing sensor histidine kinase [Nitrospirillum amazonense]MEC4595264.1 PAS domain-containing sensor histidine kinase [Nitrospirillum amazonense]TWB28449.1 PAS domain S-box-containing protein [Nitrospirillum amazonense]
MTVPTPAALDTPVLPEAPIQMVAAVQEAAPAEADAANPEDRYRRLFEQAPWGLFQTTVDGRYLDANPALARLYGYDSREDMLGTLTDIGVQLYVDAGRREAFVAEMRARGVVQGFESRIRRRDGTIIWISETCREVRDANGQPLYYEGTVEEITTRKEAEQALRAANEKAQRANEAKERFLGLVTHELRTPLHAILGFGDLIGQLDQEEVAERDDYLREITSAGNRLLRTINRLLDYTRLASGSIASELQLIELEPFVTRLVRQFGGGRDKRVRVRHDAETTAPCVLEIDGNLLNRALTELLTNALTYSPPDQAVVVEIGQRREGVTLRVIDQGRGMSPEELQAAAVPFGSVILQARARQQGLGLGLPIAQSIASMLGGHLDLASSLLNGTVATLHLPTPAAR